LKKESSTSDAPAKNYVPAIGELKVLTGFDESGKPLVRAPKRDITTRMLLLHTAGFGYDFFNATYLRLATDHGQPSVITSSMASLATPLLFDPGRPVGIRHEHRLGGSRRRRHHG
jgi:methyl acetate hydrolase